METEGRTIPWARFYDLLVWTFSLGRVQALRQKMVNASGARAGDGILDVGCGTGGLALAMEQVVGPEGRVIGTDASAKMIAVAHSKALKNDIDVNFRVGLIESISFEDASFDLVTNSLVIHHLPDDLKTRGLGEIYRVLKPGGSIFIMDMESTPGTRWQRFSDLVINVHGGHRHMENNVKKMTPLLENAGFRDIETGRLDRQYAYLRGWKPASDPQ